MGRFAALDLARNLAGFEPPRRARAMLRDPCMAKQRRSDYADAFFPESVQQTGVVDDELAQRLAEHHQRAITEGEDAEEDSPEAIVEEEMGGAFVESSPETELGVARDGGVRSPEDGEPTPLPEAVGPLALGSAEDERAAVEAREEQTGDADLPDPDAERPSPIPPRIARPLRGESARR